MPISKRKAAIIANEIETNKKIKIDSEDIEQIDSDHSVPVESEHENISEHENSSEHENTDLQQVCATPVEYKPVAVNSNTGVNSPLFKLDEQMHLISTPIKDDRGNSLLSIKITVRGVNRYINIKYAGPPQLLLVGNNSTCYG